MYLYQYVCILCVFFAIFCRNLRFLLQFSDKICNFSLPFDEIRVFQQCFDLVRSFSVVLLRNSVFSLSFVEISFFQSGPMAKFALFSDALRCSLFCAHLSHFSAAFDEIRILSRFFNKIRGFFYRPLLKFAFFLRFLNEICVSSTVF